MKSTDVRIEEVRYSYADYRYRTPIKFGGTAVDQVTLLDVEVTIQTRDGRIGRGFGSMPMGNVWAFPSRRLGYAQTLSAMKLLVERQAKLTAELRDFGHPIDLTWVLEPGYLAVAKQLDAELNLGEPIPMLASLVCASPFDAALHDAFGKIHGLNCYATYGPDFMTHDLSHYLGKDFRGETLDRYVRRTPQAKMPLYHLVGALDPLTPTDVETRLDDGLPMTLGEWIDFNGLTHLKIKLNGDDLHWDVDRVVAVDHVAQEAQSQRGISTWHYSLDFNERCRDVGYLLEFLRILRDQTPQGFECIQYIEQPTARDLKANLGNVMHEAARQKPIVIDESLTDLESLHLAHELGYTGAAFKACKGQTQSLLLSAAAQKLGLFLCVQDLTCPGASLIHSAGLAAHIPGAAAIEANARQYVPAANAGWEDRFPGIFCIKDGTLATETLSGLGLGAMDYR